MEVPISSVFTVSINAGTILNGVILVGVGIIVRGVQSVNCQLRKLNGRLIKVEQRMDDQVRICDERHRSP